MYDVTELTDWLIYQTEVKTDVAIGDKITNAKVSICIVVERETQT